MRVNERKIFETGWMATKATPNETGNGGVETTEEAPMIEYHDPGPGNIIHMLREQAPKECLECREKKRCSPSALPEMSIRGRKLIVRISTYFSKNDLESFCPLIKTRHRVIGHLVRVVEK